MVPGGMMGRFWGAADRLSYPRPPERVIYFLPPAQAKIWLKLGSGVCTKTGIIVRPSRYPVAQRLSGRWRWPSRRAPHRSDAGGHRYHKPVTDGLVGLDRAQPFRSR